MSDFNQEILALTAKLLKKTVPEILDLLDFEGLIDSLLLVEIIFSFEEEFGIEFDESDISQFKTLRNLIILTERKIDEQ